MTAVNWLLSWVTFYSQIELIYQFPNFDTWTWILNPSKYDDVEPTSIRRLCYVSGVRPSTTSIDTTSFAHRSGGRPTWPRCGAASNRPVSWNRAKCRTNIRWIAFDKSCNRRMTFKVIQGHWRWHRSIGHIWYFQLVVCNNYMSVLHQFVDRPATTINGVGDCSGWPGMVFHFWKTLAVKDHTYLPIHLYTQRS